MAYDQTKLQEEKLKLLKKVDKSFAEEVIAMMERTDANGLEFKLKELARHANAVQSQKASDEQLNRVINEKKVLEAPYREQLNQNKAKSRFVGLLLQELNGFQE